MSRYPIYPIVDVARRAGQYPVVAGGHSPGPGREVKDALGAIRDLAASGLVHRDDLAALVGSVLGEAARRTPTAFGPAAADPFQGLGPIVGNITRPGFSAPDWRTLATGQPASPARGPTSAVGRRRGDLVSQGAGTNDAAGSSWWADFLELFGLGPNASDAGVAYPGAGVAPHGDPYPSAPEPEPHAAPEPGPKPPDAWQHVPQWRAPTSPAKEPGDPDAGPSGAEELYGLLPAYLREQMARTKPTGVGPGGNAGPESVWNAPHPSSRFIPIRTSYDPAELSA